MHSISKAQSTRKSNPGSGGRYCTRTCRLHVGYCSSHPCGCIENITQTRRYTKQSLYRLHDKSRGAVSVWRILVLPGECTIKLQLSERGSSTTKLCLAVTNPRISGAQPSFKRLRLCSCHDTIKKPAEKQEMGWSVLLDYVGHIRN